MMLVTNIGQLSKRLRLLWLIPYVVALLSLQTAKGQESQGGAVPNAVKLDDAVRANMQVVQRAAELYAVDHAGQYPRKVDNEFKKFFPGGSGEQLDSLGRSGVAPTNPFTGKQEWPSVGRFTDIIVLRHSGQFSIGKGRIEYNVIQNGGYAIVGGGHNDKAVDFPPYHKGVYVISNIP